MRVIIDVMSGDNAPDEILAGAAQARSEYGVDITVCGKPSVIAESAARLDIDLDGLGIDISEADSVIEMEDNALSVIKEKSDSSMSVGLRMLAAGEGDAFVSAGNTGALLAGGTLIVRRIKGIHRAAIASVLPFPNPVLLIDSGANTEVTEDDLEQFAVMGSIYIEKLHGTRRPRVGLLNNGTEYNKGRPLEKAAWEKLSACPDINFAGNIEGKSVPDNSCDVLVTDGFTGNILLKFLEGMGKFVSVKLKGLFYQNAITKVSGLLIKNKVSDLKKDFDASEYGGAPLLGLSRPVIKAHGSSDAKAVKNAVRQAMTFVNTGVTVDIAKAAQRFTERRLAAAAEKEAAAAENETEKKEDTGR